MLERTQSDLVDFVDTAAIGLHWVAPDGTILWANPADYEPLGYTSAEYIGRNIVEFHADAATIDDILRRLSAGERLHNYEARLRCKDGSTRRVLITSSVRFAADGKFLHTRCFTSDVSRRPPEGTAAQIEALSREIERLTVIASHERGLIEAILTHSPHGIIVCDATGKFTFQNRAAEQIWAGSETVERVADLVKYHVFHPDGRVLEPSDSSMARTLRDGVAIQSEERHILCFDGTRRVVLGSSAPIFGPDGSLDGAVMVFGDITEFKKQEEELRIGAERYLMTLNSIGDAVIATDASGNITFLNLVAADLTGWSIESARGRSLSEVLQIVDEATGAPVESPLQRVLRDDKTEARAGHAILVSRDGRRLHIDDNGGPILAPNGQLAGVVVVFRDVTEKRREEDRRRFLAEAGAVLGSNLDYTETLASVARLAVPTIADWCAIDMAGEGGHLERLAVAHVDPDKIRFAKDIESRYPPDPTSPHGVHEVIRSGRAQVMAEIPLDRLTAAAVDDEHLRLILALGLKSLMIVPLRSRGHVLGAISFVSAESNRRFGPQDRLLAEELAGVASFAVENARLYQSAQHANLAKDEFLATISHELRTPLNAVLGWASMLRTSKMSEEKQARALEIIERNARVQAQLIEDLLDVSRIISGNLRLEARALDFIKIIEAAVDSVRLAADAKGVRITPLLDDDARSGSGDPGRLQQVVWNLLSNSVKFTEGGGTVAIRLSRTASQVEIVVEDSGQGIDPAFLPHIFERFKQADAAPSRSHGGLGLGLAIVKHLVELHGGTVSATSAGLGLGSAFAVRLPLAVIAARRVDDVARPGHLTAPTLAGLRILVVDDEPDARALVTTLLEGHGARVVEASSAAAALAEVEGNPPDVLVSDIGLPHEDGYSLMRKIRTLGNARSRAIPAVALTAFARTQDRTRAMLAGFQSHVAKPVEPDELLVVVAALVGRTG